MPWKEEDAENIDMTTCTDCVNLKMRKERVISMIDILIPVYNGFRDLQICLQSVEKYTDLEKNRVIFVEDCSPDERVLPFLRQWTKDHEGTVLYENEKNYGFSHNVNIGFAHSKTNDVLLLNTDTIVTKGWLEKLSRCANQDEYVGSVCPLSNNATLCSVPKFMEENKLPDGWSVDDMGDLVESCSLHRYPEIPLAVGFCMYIPRRVIETVGEFDEATFQRGYGEEDDFCYRAQQNGFRHLLCDDTYVFHTGKASFLLSEGEALTAEHAKINMSRYPIQTRATVQFVQECAIWEIGANLQKHIMQKRLKQSGKKNVLFVSHACFALDAPNHLGGIQTHIRDLVDSCKSELNLIVAAREENQLRVGIYCGEEKETLYYPIYPQFGTTRIHDSLVEHAFEDILLRFQIQAVHVHQVLELSFDIFQLAKKYGIPTYLTLHDYYFLCPNFKLVDTDGRICDGRCTDEVQCFKCMERSEAHVRISGNYVKTWQKMCYRILEGCECVFAPSQSAKDIFSGVYPNLAEKVCVIPHGIVAPEPVRLWTKDDTQKVSGQAESCVDLLNFSHKGVAVIKGWAFAPNCDSKDTEAEIEVTSKLGIQYFPIKLYDRADIAAFGGQYTHAGFSCEFSCWNLGPEVTIRILLKNAGNIYKSKNYKYELHDKEQSGKLKVVFIGGMNPNKGSKKVLELLQNLPENITVWIVGAIGDEELLNIHKKNVYFWGGYEQEEIYHILRCIQPDVAGIFSIWNETFCYTLSEVVACGIPAMVTDLGAPADRVRKEGIGWAINPENVAKDALNLLNRLCNDPNELQEKKQRTAQHQLMTIPMMGRQYLDKYCYLENMQMLPEPNDDYAPHMCKPRKLQNNNNQSQQDVNSSMQEQIIALKDQVDFWQFQLQSVYSSRSFRLTMKLIHILKAIAAPLRKIKALLRR